MEEHFDSVHLRCQQLLVSILAQWQEQAGDLALQKDVGESELSAVDDGTIQNQVSEYRETVPGDQEVSPSFISFDPTRADVYLVLYSLLLAWRLFTETRSS